MRQQNLDQLDYGLSNFRNLKSGIVTYYRLRFRGSGLVVRPLPMFDVSNKVTPTYRQNDSDTDTLAINDWLRCYPVCRIQQGPKRVTMIPFDPVEAIEDPQIAQNNPAVVFRDTIAAAIDSGATHWTSILKGTQQKGALFSFEPYHYLMLAAIISDDDQLFDVPKGALPGAPLVLLGVAKTAGEYLRKQLRENETLLVEPQANVFIHFKPHQGRRTEYGISPSHYTAHLISQDSVPKKYDFNPIIHHIYKEQITWDSFLTELDNSQIIKEFCRSSIPPAAVIHALRDLFGQYMSPHYLERAQTEAAAPASPSPPTDFQPPKQAQAPLNSDVPWDVPSEPPQKPQGTNSDSPFSVPAMGSVSDLQVFPSADKGNDAVTPLEITPEKMQEWLRDMLDKKGGPSQP